MILRFNVLQEANTHLTVNFRGEEVPLCLPPNLEWRIAVTTTPRAVIRLLLLHFHDIKSLLRYTLTGSSR